MFNLITQAFIPLFVGQYWKKSNLWGAFGGMIAGILVTVAGELYPQCFQWAGGWSPGMVGLMANLVIHVLCGLIFGKQKHVDELFDVVRNYQDPHLKKAI